MEVSVGGGKREIRNRRERLIEVQGRNNDLWLAGQRRARGAVVDSIVSFKLDWAAQNFLREWLWG